MTVVKQMTLGCVTLMMSAAGMGSPSATANPELNEFALNGTFTAISDGHWAKTNERVEDRPTVTSTWTITTSCTTAIDCSGKMTSDQGWTADVSYTEPLWYVTRVVDGWLTCPDGSVVSGQQTFKFFIDQFNKPILRGWDNTLAPSGACGVNKVLNIEMPFKLIPLE